MHIPSHSIASAVSAFILSVACHCVMGQASSVPSASIIPKPFERVDSSGSFSIGPETIVVTDNDSRASAAYLAQRLRRATGFDLPIVAGATDNIVDAFLLRIRSQSPHERDMSSEGYRLSVTSQRVEISASAPAGLFYGVQTLLQMLPPRMYDPDAMPLDSRERSLGAVQINDWPRFSWRGLMIDVSRHFFSKEQLKKTIDAMAMHKLNVLHLHLTDDTGWRIEVDRYPKLIDVGAVGDISNPGGPARLYFSKDEIREIVAYAAERHIAVVPEIDMPGHSMAAAKAYPEFFDGDRTINPANEGAYEFVENVLTEVMELFPSGYLHFGGDEVREHRWAELPKMAEFMRQQGYTEFRQVEEHFARFVTNFIAKRGFTPIGWGEVAEFDLHQDTIVQWWLHLRPQARDRAIARGHRIIISANNYLYFDYPNHAGEPGAPWEGNDNGANSLELIHQWEPVPDSWSAQQESLALGLQANLWTEFIKTDDYYEYMLFPRLSALAEVAWSPKGDKDLDDFIRRILVQTKRYEAMGLNYRMHSEWPTDFRYLTH